MNIFSSANQTLGYSSPVSKTKSGEPPNFINISPSRPSKHRKRVINDFTPSKVPIKEEKLFL